MSKKLFIASIIILLTLANKVAEAQPPPPPPDPGNLGGTPHGWVGKSPVADGYGILLALGLVYGSWRIYRVKKKQAGEIN